MKIVAGIRFKKPGKVYYFDPQDFKLERGMHVIVDTAMGEEYGEVVFPNREVKDEEITDELKKVIRITTQKDDKMREEYRAKEPEAKNIFLEKMKKHNLKMKLIDVEYKYDGSKVIFYFTAEGRIDFRELVKDLAAVLRTRIELRQIGVRDEIRRMGGNGVCGRCLCCCSFLGNFETVSIKMAKEQNISLNPSKISGNCGRLMCCLKYEEEVYAEKLKRLPNIGAIVKTADGEGEVSMVETLKERIKDRFKDGEDTFYKKYDVKDIVVIKDAEKQEEKIDVESDEDLKELEKLEKLDKLEKDTEDTIY